jgi:hypothetical protein
LRSCCTRFGYLPYNLAPLDIKGGVETSLKGHKLEVGISLTNNNHCFYSLVGLNLSKNSYVSCIIIVLSIS